ncbi:MAG: toxin-antitoxin system toxin subunit [Caldilineaceae bacterium SB0675_bin_29]|uniref:Toxin-antitoxin system toxin subunit n=1 Tax=Caldilineaceae bacterium SB0675_bin_29 TaxID=2605266 RepID=A0A6B1FVG5_9CHLR|nr:toxin-antitoxin system toxin subunit [Caldilineaceae bacterium SB0675_bin_29]
MRSAAEILTILDHTKPELERRFGVRRIGLYGSYACGTQTENSDIDLIVELKEPKFDALAGLHIYMGQVLGREVDIRRLSKKIDTPFMRRIERGALFI